jgi:iron complex transport system ATP-binding protein
MTLACAALNVSLGRRAVLRDVAAGVAAGETVGLIGPNGAGKTTLLRALAGLIAPASGAVTLDGRPLAGVDPRARARAIGYLPQDGTIHWSLPVRDVVAMGRLPHRGDFAPPGPDDRAAVAAAMAALDVDALADRPATALSGGERARVLLARVLAGMPRFLLADEPVAGLDPYHRLEVMEHLAARAEAGIGVVVVLHDLTLAARFCRRLLLVDGGRLVAEGAPAEVLTPERLAAVYRIAALAGGEGDAAYLVPHRRLPPSEPPGP